MRLRQPWNPVMAFGGCIARCGFFFFAPWCSRPLSPPCVLAVKQMRRGGASRSGGCRSSVSFKLYHRAPREKKSHNDTAFARPIKV